MKIYVCEECQSSVCETRFADDVDLEQTPYPCPSGLGPARWVRDCGPRTMGVLTRAEASAKSRETLYRAEAARAAALEEGEE